MKILVALVFAFVAVAGVHSKPHFKVAGFPQLKINQFRPIVPAVAAPKPRPIPILPKETEDNSKIVPVPMPIIPKIKPQPIVKPIAAVSVKKPQPIHIVPGIKSVPKPAPGPPAPVVRAPVVHNNVNTRSVPKILPIPIQPKI